ncbi:MAG: hypothetical protein KC478_11455 [Bacteriovoracaceae bacterium]|nr:hypothetical protein [Bacteriovoracaceae bacterium]
MNEKVIRIRGARVNNLKSVDIDLPTKAITCFAGPSGSGKTSLAFHTVYNESKRRFLNSFPNYLKFFSDRPAPVDVDEIFPVLPVFGLPQINPIVGTRSVIADTMRLSEIFQNLYFHHAQEYCPEHHTPLMRLSFGEVLHEHLVDYDDNSKFYLAISRSDFLTYFSNAPFPSRSYDEGIGEFKKSDPYWEVLRFKKKSLATLDKKLAPYLEREIDIYLIDEQDKLTKTPVVKQKICPVCHRGGVVSKSPAKFTAFNALGACSKCNGFGATLEYDREKLVDQELSVEEGGVKFLEYKRFHQEYEDLYWELKAAKISTTKAISELPEKFWKILYQGKGQFCGLEELFKWLETKKYKPSVRIFVRGKQKEVLCPNCHGTRISPEVEHFYLEDKVSFYDIWKMDLGEVYEYFSSFDMRSRTKDFKALIKKLLSILETALGIGLGHLKLTRKVKSVSAGEYQRLLLLKHLSYEGTGALFIFDEPSLGLSDEEKGKLFNGLRNLVDQGNTVFLIDHSDFFHSRSDRFVFIGPESGKRGGEVIFNGDYEEFRDKHPFKVEIAPQVPEKRKWIEVKAPQAYNKVFSDFKIPLNEITWVTGPSGSGKTARVLNVLANELHYKAYGTRLDISKGEAKSIKSAQKIDDVFVIDANLNRYTSRSTFGSMTDMFSIVRKHFLKTAAAKSMGLKEGHLSPNSALGQCPACEGRGVKVVEMQFLEDIVLKCEDCKGLKLKPIYASLSDGEMTVAEAYSMPVSEVVKKIKLTPKYRRINEYLKILKLDYLSLDRGVNSLSGGEKQRLYLLNQLQKEIYNSLLVFENLSFGLSKRELQAVCLFLQKLTAQNNTIALIDQNHFYENVASYKLDFS